MYEEYSRQSLPSKQYRELLGSALCVFNSNNSFVIENILRITDEADWYELIDKPSGRISQTLKKNSHAIPDTILELFSKLVEMRNRIIHSFQITIENKMQILATKTPINQGNRQFVITEEYLLNFIRENEKLSDLLYEWRNSLNEGIKVSL